MCENNGNLKYLHIKMLKNQIAADKILADNVLRFTYF